MGALGEAFVGLLKSWTRTTSFVGKEIIEVVRRPGALFSLILGPFLIMGLFGIIIASLVNVFLGSDQLQWIISVIGVIVFAGLTAWDTQKIKEMYDPMDDGTVGGRKAVMGALSLYLDFINLFLYLLRILGQRR